MRVFKPSPRHRCWHAELTDHRGLPRRCSTYQRDRALAIDCGNMIEVLVGTRRNGEPEPPPRLHPWLDAMPAELRELLIKWELLDAAWWARRTSMRTPLIEHQGAAHEVSGLASPLATCHSPLSAATLTPTCLLGQWREILRGTGATDKHVRGQVNNVFQVFGEGACAFAFLEDIDAAVVSRTLLAWRGEKKMSVRRSNALRQSCWQFCQWLKRKFGGVNRLDDDAVLPRLNEKLDPRRVRRGLDVAEARSLITDTVHQPHRYGLCGLGRSLVYHVAVTLGLRHDEIRRLRRCDFELGEIPLFAGVAPSPGGGGCVTVPAGVSKNRKEATKEIPADLADRLRDYFKAGRFAPAARPFPMEKGRGAEMLRADLAAAKIESIDGAGRVIDFHSLRHTAGVWSFTVYGLNAREAQEHMRVSSLDLVMRYSSSMQLRTSTWINKTPSLAPQAEKEKTG